MPPYAEYNIIVFWTLLKTAEQKACSESTASQDMLLDHHKNSGCKAERWEREAGSNREFEGIFFGSLLGLGEGFLKYSKFSQLGL